MITKDNNADFQVQKNAEENLLPTSKFYTRKIWWEAYSSPRHNRTSSEYSKNKTEKKKFLNILYMADGSQVEDASALREDDHLIADDKKDEELM